MPAKNWLAMTIFALAAITDYGYVTSDLRRIGLLAGVAFAVLIGLTFVLH